MIGTPPGLPPRCRPCPVCGRDGPQKLVMPFVRAAGARPEPVEMPVVRCAACGMVYADLSDAAAADCNEHYGLEQLEAYLKLATRAEYWAYRAQLKALGAAPPGGRLLDYGAGIGSLMLIAQHLGWDARGVDPSPYSAWARDRLGLDIFVGRLDESPYPDGYFDAVATLSTLEHIWHLDGELRAIHRKLRPGGLLLAGGVPNFASVENLAARRLGRSWTPVFYRNAPPAHINFFTPRTARAIVRAASFSEVRVSTYGSKWVSELEVRKQAGEGRAAARPPADPATLSHPFLQMPGPAGGRPWKWIVTAYMQVRLPFGGDKLLIVARK